MTCKVSTGRRRACLQLALVLRFIEVTLRLGNEAIGTNRPLLVAANSNRLASAALAGVRAGPRQRKIAWLPSWLTWSIFTTMSGNAVMNPRAVSVMAVRPTDGALPLTVRDPFSL